MVRLHDYGGAKWQSLSLRELSPNVMSTINVVFVIMLLVIAHGVVKIKTEHVYADVQNIAATIL